LSPLLIYFVFLAFFLVLSVFFSAAETAYIAVNRLRIKYQAEAGDKEAEAIHRIVRNPDRLLGVILLGVTVAEISAAGLATSIIASYFSPKHAEIASLAGSIVFAFIVLIICELTLNHRCASGANVQLLLLVRFCIAPLSLCPIGRLDGQRNRTTDRIH
jgi:Mg2+/Co2+ transporter CorB